MLFKHQAELLLLLHPRHLFIEPRPQIRIIDSIYQITYY